MSDALVEPPAPLALGPGDDDPRSPAVPVVDDGAAPLGPGDDDPRSPAGAAALIAAALGPGDATGPDLNEGHVLLAPPAHGPGDTPVQRAIVRIPMPVRPADE